RDAGHIQESDVEYINNKRARQGLPPVEPLYTVEDATNSLRYFVSIGYGRPLLVAPGVTLTFHNAGHILGSAVTVLDIVEGSKARRLVFTGDLGRKEIPILRDPEPVENADYLITESTYGSRLHDPFETSHAELREVIINTYHQGGKVIVPAFSV
ncbi:MAG: MBL fold metallo-hydrolase, partial [Anaerolineae bacterium]|nr:MBL fold metallo-hydrolase [Anaerolineae bacterium]